MKTVTTIIGTGVYAPRRVAFLARTNTASVRRWVSGYRRGDQVYAPVIRSSREATEGEARVYSFTDLVELGVISRLRAAVRLPLPAIRDAYELMAKIYDVARPFAWKGLRTDGHNLFLEMLEESGHPIVQLTGKNKAQAVIPEVLEAYLLKLRFGSDGMADRFYPLGEEQHVVVDPQIAFGEPVIAGTRIPTRVLFEFLQAGDTPEKVARWYDVSLQDVERARKLESGKWAA